MIKLFYSPPWKAFIAPEKRAFTLKANTKPLVGAHYFEGHERAAYEKAYAEAKANALEVGNYGEIYTIANDNLDREITLPCTEIDGVEYFDWKGSAVIKDGKYILSI